MPGEQQDPNAVDPSAENDGRQPRDYGQPDGYDPQRHGRGPGRQYGQTGGFGARSWPAGGYPSELAEGSARAPAPDATPRRGGSAADPQRDARIERRLAERLVADEAIAAAGLSFEVCGGRVTLRGTVDSQRARAAIEEHARACGATDVVDELTVDLTHEGGT